jgi:tetratricopeptide (TPR) repeat protein
MPRRSTHTVVSRRLPVSLLCFILGAGTLGGLAGCSKDDVDAAREKMAREKSTPTPDQAPASPHGSMGDAGSAPGAPMAGAPNMGSNGPNDGNAVPLKLTGLGSAAELNREMAKLTDKVQAAHFESAFRLTFSSDMSKRDYQQAEELVQALIAAQPRFAPAYRTLAYAEFNLNPSETAVSMQHYEKAVELEPEYGEAHYAIAFMCAATGEREKGVEHYKKAMALGVVDERNIGERFYKDLLQPQ